MVGPDGRGEIRLQRLQRPRVSTARSTTTSTKYRSKSKFPRQRSVVDGLAWRGFRMAARRRRSTSIGSTSMAAVAARRRRNEWDDELQRRALSFRYGAVKGANLGLSAEGLNPARFQLPLLAFLRAQRFMELPAMSTRQ